MNFTALRKTLALFSALTLILCVGVAAQDVLEGDGTTANPYKVSTVQDLALVREMTENGETEDACFRMENDIVLNEVKDFVTSNGYISEAGEGITAFSPIGTAEKPFEGSFDGDGYYITGLYVSKNAASGLFGVVNNGKIENLNMDFALVEAKEYAGIVAGKLEGASSISNVVVSGSVIGKQQELASVVGGIAGSVSENSWISDSCSYTCVAGANAFSSNVGGIAGTNYGDVSKCTFGGKAHGVSMYFASAVGGICGANSGEITGCLSDGEVSGESASAVNECYVGGIAGKNSGSVGECHNKSDVEVSCYSVVDSICTAGGIVGYNADADIYGCQNDGSVVGAQSYAGGIAGLSFVTQGQHSIEDCLNVGTISGTDGVAGGVVARASVSGYVINTNTVSSSMNLGKVSGATAGGFVGLVYEENEDCMTFENCYTDSQYADEYAAPVTSEEYTEGWNLEGLAADVWKFEIDENPCLVYPDGISKSISSITAQTEQKGKAVSDIVSQGVGSVSFAENSETNGVFDVIVRYSGDNNSFAPKSVVVKFTLVALNKDVKIVSVDLSGVTVKDGVLDGSITVKVQSPGGVDATLVAAVNSDSFTGAKFSPAKNEGEEYDFTIDVSGISSEENYEINVMIIENTEKLSPICENVVVSNN